MFVFVFFTVWSIFSLATEILRVPSEILIFPEGILASPSETFFHRKLMFSLGKSWFFLRTSRCFLFFPSVRNIGNTKSLPERVFSLTSLLDHSSFLDLLILKFGYFPVIIILKYYINATIVIYIILVYKLLIKSNYVTII